MQLPMKCFLYSHLFAKDSWLSAHTHTHTKKLNQHLSLGETLNDESILKVTVKYFNH